MGTNAPHVAHQIIERLRFTVHITLTLWKILAEILLSTEIQKMSVELLVYSAVRELHYIAAPQKTKILLSTGRTDCATVMIYQFAVKLFSQSDSGPHCQNQSAGIP